MRAVLDLYRCVCHPTNYENNDHDLSFALGIVMESSRELRRRRAKKAEVSPPRLCCSSKDASAVLLRICESISFSPALALLASAAFLLVSVRVRVRASVRVGLGLGLGLG